MDSTDIERIDRKVNDISENSEILEARLGYSGTTSALLQNPTEDNVALAFAEFHAGKFVFIHGIGRWFRWNGKAWRSDSTLTIENEIRRLARAFNIKGHHQPARHSFVTGVEKHLRSEPVFAREASDFDHDNYLLNCPNGTYNLTTGECKAHDPTDCITLITSAAPTPKGGERFLHFLEEVTSGDGELQRFLQISLGACLSGAIEEHWLMFWVGRSRAGKNTLGEAVLDVMGDYASVIPSRTLMAQKGQAHPTEIMSLKGQRYVISSEIEEGSYWAEAKIKELTGDANLTGHYMRQDWVVFPRTHKHVIFGNHKPLLRNIDEAIKSRIKIVPFKASFIGREDPNLKADLNRESGFILHWLIEGHRIWMDSGKKIGTCRAVESESNEYFQSQSSLELWLEERCDVMNDTVGAGRSWPKSSELYFDYKNWMSSRGEVAPSQTRFGDQMGQRFQKVRSAGVRYSGIRLKSMADDSSGNGW